MTDWFDKLVIAIAVITVIIFVIVVGIEWRTEGRM